MFHLPASNDPLRECFDMAHLAEVLHPNARGNLPAVEALPALPLPALASAVHYIARKGADFVLAKVSRGAEEAEILFNFSTGAI